MINPLCIYSRILWAQARRGGGGSFPGPRDVWGPRHMHCSKILKGWLLSELKYA